MSAIHAGMRDTAEGVPGKSELDKPRPSCAPCSADYRVRTNLPARVLVERALVVRADTGGYLVICHCHGASDVIELAGTNPDEHDVASAVAFTRKRG